MLLQSLSALHKAPGGGGSIWKGVEALVSTTGVSERFAYDFWTDLHSADIYQIEMQSEDKIMQNKVFNRNIQTVSE
jgi:hypothetical protein